MTWCFETDAAYAHELEWISELVTEEILPLETLELDFEQYHALTAPLRARVKERGLWAAFLGPELGGSGLGQVKLALMHEILGRSELAPPVFGCQPPDSGNIELLAIGGTEEQKERWLTPLLEGEIFSAFAMTEVGTGSDPTQFTTSATRTDEGWVINGAKFFVSAASRARFHIVMAVTDPNAPRKERASMFIVPADSPGITVRPLGSMNDPRPGMSPVHSQAEVIYDGVEVGPDALLGDVGGAFALAQRRLGPGRIHHCMRWVGVCRRAFDALCERAASVEVHGGRLGDKQMVQEWIADSAAAIESFRLLTLQAAWKIDRHGTEAALTDISMIKYLGGKVMQDVVDRAVQIHGALGYSTDMPLEAMYRWARASRLYDGPDEVHKVSAARRILKSYEPRAVPSEHVPTRHVEARARLAAAR